MKTGLVMKSGVSNMKKINKKDILYCLIPIILFFILILLLTNNKYFFLNNLEYSNITNIFRTMFYDTKDLLPDYIYNLNNGTPIYSLTYYGFLSPITVLSYFFPNTNMITYLTITTIITVIISTILLYVFLRKQKMSSEISLLSTLFFITSASISLNSHTHIAFINYFPFLILALFGVDKKLNDNKGILLTISMFFITMTSVHFTIPSIVTILTYSIYKYLCNMKKVTLKTFLKMLMSILTPIIIALFISAIVTIPTIVTNIIEGNKTITEIFKIHNQNPYIYSQYGLGLPLIVIISAINFIKNKKENMFLSIILIFITIIPYFNSFNIIPLLPLYIFLIANFLKDLFNHEVNYKKIIPILLIISILIIISKYQTKYYIYDLLITLIIIFTYELFNKKQLIIIPTIIFASLLCYSINTNEISITKYLYNENTNNIETVLNKLTDYDKTIYHTYNELDNGYNLYNNTKYFSNNTNQDIFNLIKYNNKYIITNKETLHGYEEIYNDSNGIRIYKNENVLPFGYASSNIMNYEDYNKLDYFKQKEALLNVILLDQKSNNDYVSDIKPTNITIKDIFKTNKLDITKDTTIIYELPKKYKNKIILISLDVSSKDESIIKINNVSNNTKDNKLYYIISEEELNELYIHLPKNTYTISNLEISYLDPAHIENINSNIDKLVIDHNNSKGDTLQGTIEVTKDSYLTLLLPYKKGFNIYVDGELTEYQETNNNNIGLPIKTGIHDIEIEYQVPYKSITIVVSTLGILILCTVTYLEYKRKF